MNRLCIPAYTRDIERIVASDLPWADLANTSVLITGATGMIGTLLVDVLMRANELHGLHCRVIAISRDASWAQKRLPYHDDRLFSIEELEIGSFGARPSERADLIIHLASPTHPRAYASNPIGTIQANVIGLQNLLDYAAAENSRRILFASSVEIYGENRGDTERFDEGYCGYIDCNTVRAGYTEAKRLGEAMCQAYRAQLGIDAVIARIARAYGPTLLPSDSKALSQFIHNALAGRDVTLKSAGMQRFSYLHASDVVSGILYLLFKGSSGEAYNLSDEASDTKLIDLAHMVAEIGGVSVVLDLPDAVEQAGYSKATYALMDGSKTRNLGWGAAYTLPAGIKQTLEVLRETSIL